MNRGEIKSFIRRLSRPNPPVRFYFLWWSFTVLALCTCRLLLLPGNNEVWSSIIIAGVASHTAIAALTIALQYKMEPQCQALLSNARSTADSKSLNKRTYVSPWFGKIDAMVSALKEEWSTDARCLQFDVEFKVKESEANRVAKELHDEVLPSLSRLARTVAGAQDQSTGDLIAETYSTIGAFRDLLGELHPVDLEELGLVEAVNNLCTRYARLTGRLICFNQEVGECALGELQQLCLYRALQSALRMFTESQNDILVVSCHRIGENYAFIMRCVDRRVSSGGWLAADKAEFGSFESWCTMAGAHTEIGIFNYRGFPCDLIITIPVPDREQAGDHATDA